MLRMGYRESARFHDMATDEGVGRGEFGRSSGTERSTGTTGDARERLLEGARGVAGKVGRARRTFVRVARCASRVDVDATDLIVTPLANWTPELLSEPVSVPERPNILSVFRT